MATAATLLEARAVCEHGQWLPFLARAGVHERTARRMLKVAEWGLQIGHVSDLGGPTGALYWIAYCEALPDGRREAVRAIMRGEWAGGADRALHVAEWFLIAVAVRDCVATWRTPRCGEPASVEDLEPWAAWWNCCIKHLEAEPPSLPDCGLPA